MATALPSWQLFDQSTARFHCAALRATVSLRNAISLRKETSARKERSNP
jgi:hypothetical protein